MACVGAAVVHYGMKHHEAWAAAKGAVEGEGVHQAYAINNPPGALLWFCPNVLLPVSKLRLPPTRLLQQPSACGAPVCRDHPPSVTVGRTPQTGAMDAMGSATESVTAVSTDQPVASGLVNLTSE